MTRHARLRLAEDRDKLADGELRLVEQAEDAQPRLLPGRLEPGEQGRKTGRLGATHVSVFRHKHIFMSNLARLQGESAR